MELQIMLYSAYPWALALVILAGITWFVVWARRRPPHPPLTPMHFVTALATLALAIYLVPPLFVLAVGLMWGFN